MKLSEIRTKAAAGALSPEPPSDALFTYVRPEGKLPGCVQARHALTLAAHGKGWPEGRTDVTWRQMRPGQKGVYLLVFDGDEYAIPEVSPHTFKIPRWRP